jgi:hypothetical protein
MAPQLRSEMAALELDWRREEEEEKGLSSLPTAGSTSVLASAIIASRYGPSVESPEQTERLRGRWIEVLGWYMATMFSNCLCGQM